MRAAVGFCFLLLCACPNALAGYEAGVAAFWRGDCDSAYQELSDAALKGDSRALVSEQSINKACCTKPPPTEDETEFFSGLSL
jgi:hypothetical protein